MKRLFGTDGIRGIAGDWPLDPPTVRRFGVALAAALLESGIERRRVVLGRDTRESGPWLRDAVAAGLAAGGVEVVDSGVISTPGLAHVVVDANFDAGVMISASHNPFRDNGLKVFGTDGYKLHDRQESRIEALILDGGADDPGPSAAAPTVDPTLTRHYVRFLEGVVARDTIAGRRFVLDCANGSASAFAAEIFRHYGAEITLLGTAPDGRNINLGCGSLHLEGLSAEVVRTAADLGIAFDGDADRMLAVDARGRAFDGDHVLYLVARMLRRAGRLPQDAVVATIMSNLWLEERLRDEGMSLHRAPVGDKYVLERMLAEGAALGGEQSGHVIFREHSTTGDGVLTALMLIAAIAEEDRALHEILDSIVPCPQVLLGVRVRERPELTAHPRIGPAVAEVVAALSTSGRVVLRYSGTEPLVRVMVEGHDEVAVRSHAERLAGVIRDTIGV